MGQTLSRNWFKIVTGALLLIIVASLVYQFSQQGKPQTSTLKNHGKAENFELTDAFGKTVKLSDSDGKVRLVYFFYSNCPDVCSPTSFLMAGVQDKLKEKGVFGSKTAFYSITIDPARDTSDVLKGFAGLFHADFSGWSFLRGTEQQTQTLTEKYQITSLKDQNGDYTHSNIIFLIDAKGNIRYYYNGSDIELTKERIAQDMIQLSNEK